MKARLALAVGVPAFVGVFAGAIAVGYFMGQTSFRHPVSSAGRVMPAIPPPAGSPAGPEGAPGSTTAGQPSSPGEPPVGQPGNGEPPLNPGEPPTTSVPASPEPPAPQTPATPPGPGPTTPAVPGPTTTPAIPAPPSRFHVQAGSFDDRGAAASLVQQLRDRGYAVTLVEGPPYRVWVGGYLDRATADRLAANLQAAGFEATLTPR